MAGAPQYDGGFWWMFAEFSHVTCRMSQPRHCWEPSVLLEMVCNLLCRFLEKHFRDRCDGNHRNLVEKNMKKVCHAVSTGCPEHYYFLGKTNMWWSTQVRLDQPWWSEQYSDVFCEQTSNILKLASQYERVNGVNRVNEAQASRSSGCDGMSGQYAAPANLGVVFE